MSAARNVPVGEIGARHICEVDCCERRAPWRVYCEECELQIEEGLAWHAKKAARQELRRIRWARIEQAITRRLWIIGAVIVIVGIAYLSIVFSDAWVEWIKQGGLR